MLAGRPCMFAAALQFHLGCELSSFVHLTFHKVHDTINYGIPILFSVQFNNQLQWLAHFFFLVAYPLPVVFSQPTVLYI